MTKCVHQYQKSISGTGLDTSLNANGYFHFNIFVQNYGTIHIYIKASGVNTLPKSFEICAASLVDDDNVLQFIYPS